MIREALGWLVTPCGPEARRLGYLSESLALAARRRRCRAAWQPHIDAAQGVVRDAVARCRGRGRVVVLGSGLLAEIPLEALAESFAEVMLVDMVHLPSVRRRARRLPNVRLVERDVTGTAEALAHGRRPEPAPPPLAEFAADLAVSANLLSQLPLLPLERLDGPGAAAFARALIEGHLDWLKRLAPVACLITDVERLTVDGQGVRDRSDALFGVELPPGGREWLWTVAPRPELFRDADRVHRMVGFADLAPGQVAPPRRASGVLPAPRDFIPPSPPADRAP
ncbi:MAG TPA: hypothetical protein VEB64_00940 [Azospirillaceae bacterium]|nr:hypothetical protein [Azospirillaceae bacterium]